MSARVLLSTALLVLTAACATVATPPTTVVSPTPTATATASPTPPPTPRPNPDQVAACRALTAVRTNPGIVGDLADAVIDEDEAAWNDASRALGEYLDLLTVALQDMSNTGRYVEWKGMMLEYALGLTDAQIAYGESFVTGDSSYIEEGTAAIRRATKALEQANAEAIWEDDC